MALVKVEFRKQSFQPIEPSERVVVPKRDPVDFQLKFLCDGFDQLTEVLNYNVVKRLAVSPFALNQIRKVLRLNLLYKIAEFCPVQAE